MNGCRTPNPIVWQYCNTNLYPCTSPRYCSGAAPIGSTIGDRISEIESDRSSRPRVQRTVDNLTYAILEALARKVETFPLGLFPHSSQCPPPNVKWSSTVSRLASPHPDKPEEYHQAPVVRFHPEFPETLLFTPPTLLEGVTTFTETPPECTSVFLGTSGPDRADSDLSRRLLSARPPNPAPALAQQLAVQEGILWLQVGKRWDMQPLSVQHRHFGDIPAQPLA